MDASTSITPEDVKGGEGRARSRLSRSAEAIAGAAALVTLGLTIATIVRMRDQTLLSPAGVAFALFATLVPAMLLLVLIGRRVARARVARRGGGDARLHVRLVLLFSATAAVPTLMVVLLSSYMFQSGMQFWFSDRSRGMFENALGIAQGFLEAEVRDVGANTAAMAHDLRAELNRVPMNAQPFNDFYVQQVVVRELSESAVLEVGEDGIVRTVALIDPSNSAATNRLPPDVISRLRAGEEVVARQAGDRVEAVTQLLPGRPVYLYTARGGVFLPLDSVGRAGEVFADYNVLFARSRNLQYRFLAALFIGALLLVGLVIAVAIAVADRIVRPIDQLVEATQAVAGGNLTASVPHPSSSDPDEIALLARAFNDMTERLRVQTGDLVETRDRLEERRAFIEAVLGAVATGVVSLDASRRVMLGNAAAAAILGRTGEDLAGQRLDDIAPPLATWVDSSEHGAIVTLDVAGESRTLAVRMTGADGGRVLTFDDLSQQLSDQRRAAWSDVARRIAHEIKNPLTPIQLAAERLQRRFGPAEEKDRSAFERLTSTIVRQVGDLRRMVDEFSRFAQMPRPVFRRDSLTDVIRQSIFLQEIAKPDIRFSFHGPDEPVELICDRRLLAQAFTNLLKNAVEAIERGPNRPGVIDCALSREGDVVRVAITDNGAGLPAQRASITEPYVTTRDGGTGLGLAVVSKIVEDHAGTLSFADRDGGGTVVVIEFDTAKLAARADQG